VGQSKSVESAICQACSRRIALQPIGKVLKYHKAGWDSCPGTSTIKYSEVLPFHRPSYVPPRLSRRPRPRIPVLMVVSPSGIPSKQPDTPEIGRRSGPFRLLPYENWLNRWERKFEVKIPDENVKILSHDKYVRRSEK